MRPLVIFSLAATLAAAVQPRGHGLSPEDLGQIRAGHERGRHAISKVGGIHKARNLRQQWVTQFDGRGFSIHPDGGSWTWGLDVVSAGFTSSEAGVSGHAAASANGSKMYYRWPNGIVEWYDNSAAGLEHGFTIERRPAGSGELNVALAVRGNLRLRVSDSGDTAAFETLDGSPAVTYSKLVAWDASGTRLASRMRARDGHLILSVDAAKAKFPVTIDPIAQQAYVKASNTGSNDQFASALAISGDTVVVGAPLEDSAGTGVNSGTQSDNSAADSGAA